MFKKLLTVLFLLTSIPNSVASQAGDQIDEVIDWINIETVYRCSRDRFATYVDGLGAIYRESELFLGNTRVTAYDHELRQYQVIEGTMGFFVNQDSGTFTVVVLFEDGSFCELLTGIDFVPFTR